MKNWQFKLLFVGFVAGVLTLALQSFAPPAKGIPSFYSVAFTKDTITDAENDTLYLPKQYNIAPTAANMADLQTLRTYAYFITRTNLSGTTNVAVSLQESGALSPGASDWVTIGTTAATTATAEKLAGTEVTGRHQRLIIDGTGTQGSSYQIWAILKAK